MGIPRQRTSPHVTARHGTMTGAAASYSGYFRFESRHIDRMIQTVRGFPQSSQKVPSTA
jgi:hypothetical protein